MPSDRVIESAYLGPFTNVEAFHQNLLGSAQMGFAALYQPGAAGTRVVLTETGTGSKEYQLCQIDSGATSATPTGAITQGQLMYWKNRATYTVTNDSRFSDAGSAAAVRNQVQPVAGVLVTTTTGSTAVAAQPGDWVYLQTRGQCAVILSQQASPAVYDFAIPNNSATVPRISNSAVGTAPGDTLVGRYLSATVTNNVALVDLQIPTIP